MGSIISMNEIVYGPGNNNYGRDKSMQSIRTITNLKIKEDKVQKKETNKLYNYIFHFNHFTEQWAAIPRDMVSVYFNDMNSRISKGILYAKDMTTLVEFLNK